MTNDEAGFLKSMANYALRIVYKTRPLPPQIFFVSCLKREKLINFGKMSHLSVIWISGFASVVCALKGELENVCKSI